MNTIKSWLSQYKISGHTIVGLVGTAVLLYATNTQFHDAALQVWASIPAWAKPILVMISALSGVYVNFRNGQASVKNGGAGSPPLKIVAFACLLLLIAIASPVEAQTPQPTTTFSFTASAVSLSGQSSTSPATDVGGTVSITKNLALREDSLIAPSPSMTGIYGGENYLLPMGWIKKTVLPQNSFQLYQTASLGVVRVNPSGAPTLQRIGALAGFGLNYDPTNSGKFSINLFEIRADYNPLPGFNKWSALFSSGVSFKLPF